MRELTPELLDILPADDPHALASRRDLVWINALMRHRALMLRALADLPPPRRLADLGSGDGLFLLSLACRLAPRWKGVEVVILDRQPALAPQTSAAFAALGWHCRSLCGDVFDTLAGLDADIITANLFLHHLDDAALARLLAIVARSRANLIACEPRRAAVPLAAAHLLFLLGCNAVTRHDAVASVRAGFRGNELSCLWPDEPGWHISERVGFPFSHVFVARHV